MFYLPFFSSFLLLASPLKGSATLTKKTFIINKAKRDTQRFSFKIESFFEKHKVCLSSYLSPLLPKSFDFFYKNQASVKSLRDLYFLSDGDFVKQTKGTDNLIKLGRNLSTIQFIHLIEKSLSSKVNFSKGLTEEDKEKLANGLIQGRLVNLSKEIAETSFPLFIDYIKKTKTAQSLQKDSQKRLEIEQSLVPLRAYLIDKLKDIEESLLKVLMISLKNITKEKNCGSLRNLKRMEGNIGSVPEKFLDKKINLMTERLQKLNESK